QLAEDVTGSKRRKRDRAAVGMLTHRAGTARAHDVTRVARIPLPEHDLTGLKRARHRKCADPSQIVLLERREYGHTPQQLDYIPQLHRRHALEISQPKAPRSRPGRVPSHSRALKSATCERRDGIFTIWFH